MGSGDGRRTQRTARLTLDLPADVHRSLKSRCALVGVAMVDLLRALIDDALAGDDDSLLARVDRDGEEA